MQKKIIAAALAIIFALALTGCNMVFVNEEKDREQVVAKVGEETVLKGYVLDRYETYKAIYGITDASAKTESGRESIRSLKTSLLDDAISETVALIKARELGVAELSDAQKKELEKTLQSNREYVEKNVRENADNPENEDAIQRAIEAAYKENGLTPVDGGPSVMERSLTLNYITENLKEYLVKDYAASDSDLQAWYDENLAKQKETLSSNLSYLSVYEGSGLALYIPEGLRNVKNMLIGFSDDVKKQISDLRSNGQTEDADKLRDAELAKIKSRADEAYQKATAPGADWDAVMAEYTDDPGMQSGDSKDTGYRIYEGITSYDESFVSAGMGLKNPGDVSEPVASDNGYYIIQYASAVQSREVPLSELKENIRKEVVTEKKDSEYSAKMATWKEEISITRYEDVLLG